MRLVMTVGVLTAVLLSSFRIATAQTVEMYAASCSVDREIPLVDRADAEDLALYVAQNLVRGNADKVYATLPREARSNIGPDKVAALAQTVNSKGPFENIHVIHTYLIEVKGGGDPLPPMVCGKSFSDPERVAVSMRALPRQFHVEIAAHSRNNDWSIFVWLIPEQGHLKALSLSFNASAISGLTARDLRQLALDQNSRGHALNATLLYRAAEAIAGRGPNATPAWKQDLDKEVAAFIAPRELAGKPPFVWRLDDQVFNIAGVSVMGVDGGLHLVFDRRLDRWESNADADADNRKFVTAITKAYPEFSDSFQSIVARAHKPDGSGGFGTVYQFGKGFDRPL